MRVRGTTIVVFAAAIGCLGGRDAMAQVTVSLSPPVVALRPGERTLVTVAVEHVPQPGLAAFQITVRYDPHDITLADPNASGGGQGVNAFAPLGNSPLCGAVRGGVCNEPGWMLTATGRKAVGVAKLDADKGELTIAYGTAGSEPLPAGGGALALVEVVGKSGEAAHLDVVEFIAADGAEPPQTYPWSAR